MMSSGAALISGNAAGESRAATRTRWLSWAFLTALLLFYVAIQGWILKASNFYAYLNDFWFLRQLGDRFTGLNPGALQDGFFPYLYPLLQKLLPESIALQVSASASLVFAVGVILIVYIASSRIVGPGWALVAAWIVAFQPDFFTYATVAGADMLSAVPVAGAVLLLVLWCAGRHQGSPWLLFWSGFLMGVGGSLRHHVLLLAVVPLTLALQNSGNRARSFLFTFAGAAISYAPQIIVNVASGHAPYSTLQSFNIYRVVVGVDWLSTSTLDPNEYSSPIRVLVSHPYEFAISYLHGLEEFAVPLFLVSLAVFFTCRSPWRKLTWSLLAGTYVYVALVALAFSPRAVVVLVPIWGLAAALLVGVAAARLAQLSGRVGDPGYQWSAVAVASSGLLLFTLPWLRAGISQGLERVELEIGRQQVKHAISEQPLEGDTIDLITNDYDFYSLESPAVRVRYIGGIAPISQTKQSDPLYGIVDLETLVCENMGASTTYVLWRGPYSDGIPSELGRALVGDVTDPLIQSEPLLRDFTWSRLNSESCTARSEKL